MKKGFTLLELVVVIIIIGILATVAFVQYTKAVEKSRTAEAKAILGQIRTAQKAYQQEYNAYTITAGNLIIAPINSACTNQSATTPTYFSYDITTSNSSATATRCTADGKSPPGSEAYVITVSYDTGAWSGTAGYY